MKLLPSIKMFNMEEAGALRIDWVVMTSILILFGGVLITVAKDCVTTTDAQTAGQQLNPSYRPTALISILQSKTTTTNRM